jgi:hypothetical protein
MPRAAQLVTGRNKTTCPPPKKPATTKVNRRTQTKEASRIVSGFQLLLRRRARTTKPVSTEMERRTNMIAANSIAPNDTWYATARRRMFVIKKTIAIGLRRSDQTQNNSVVRGEIGNAVLFSRTGYVNPWYCARSVAP